MYEFEYRLAKIEKNLKANHIEDGYYDWVTKSLLLDIKKYRASKNPKQQFLLQQNIKNKIVSLIYYSLTTNKYKINEFMMKQYNVLYDEDLYLKIN